MARRFLRRRPVLVRLAFVAVVGAVLVPGLCTRGHTRILDVSDPAACAANLSNLYKGLVLYKNEHRRLPIESGTRFLAVLYSSGAISHSRTNAQRMTCPAVPLDRLATASLPWEEWWADLDAVDGTYTAYAGRNNAEYPLVRLSREEPIAACDNELGMNHEDVTNVLFGDGSVQAFSLKELKASAMVDPAATVLIVGPDSPIPVLRKLTP